MIQELNQPLTILKFKTEFNIYNSKFPQLKLEPRITFKMMPSNLTSSMTSAEADSTAHDSQRTEVAVEVDC